MKRVVQLAAFVVLVPHGHTTAQEPSEPLRLHVVPTPLKSYRLLSMSMDEDGFVWAGSIHQAIHRYDPRTGKAETIGLPSKATASACICVGPKVYVLGQSYPRLIIYDRKAKAFREVDYPSAKPDVWYGTDAIEGKLYFFDRSGKGVIRWDTQSDQCEVIAYPYQTPMPSSGRYDPVGRSIWCNVWDVAGGKYIPLGLARLDPEKGKFDGWFPFPKDETGLQEYADPGSTLFLPYSLQGKLVPFDLKQRRWCRSIAVPGFGERFGFLGGPVAHRGRLYFSLSTYNGTDTGCDGKPYHFCNSVLQFDPKSKKSEFLTLETKDAYYQIAYMLSAGGEFFATGTNIREADGTLNGSRAGEVVFWQTKQVDKK